MLGIMIIVIKVYFPVRIKEKTYTGKTASKEPKSSARRTSESIGLQVLVNFINKK